jgi:lactoylglutathione lyase
VHKTAPVAGIKVFLATLLIVRDLDRSREYYERMFGTTCVHESNRLIMKSFDSYIIMNVEAGPTHDEPLNWS